MLDERIQKLIDEQKDGIDVRSLKPGTKVFVNTKNSEYIIETTSKPGYVKAQGGRYFPEVQECYFNGSTWGGSMLKLGWIGRGMHLEFSLEDGRTLTTTGVRKARIEGADWHYDFDWN